MRRPGQGGRGPVNIYDTLRLFMAALGMLLILAIGKKCVDVMDQEPGEAVFDWKERLGTGLAEALVRLDPKAGWQEEQKRLASIPPRDSLGDFLADLFVFGNPFVRYPDSDRNEGVKDSDPAYEEYKELQAVRQEYQYFLLYGDENSGVSYGEAERVETETEREPVCQEAENEIKGSLPAVSGKQYAMEQLMDYDFLMKQFYSVHSSTTAKREELNAEELLAVDLTMEKKEEPQILVYHTHSQEAFADYGPSNQEATIVSVGVYLTELLRAKGYQVIHDTSQYDMIDGKLDRNHAYNYALEGISGILQEHPSIQVILDLHRDGVAEDLHMVKEIGGKPTAPVMFFNGMSQTPEGPIEYLQNPYKKENLAFSLKLQLNAAAYYPGYTRKIYLKGLRYNLHLRPRSALIEVGAQTNTFEEAKNAMEPLAELIDMVLQGQGIYIS